MNINETTGEVIKRSVYEDIRKNFQNRALNWNGIWKVWAGNSPDWIGRYVHGWEGNKIQMHDKIPESKRDTKRKEYSGRDGEVNQNISEESSLIHTTGNENNIRRSIKELNNEVTKNFGAEEYSAVTKYSKRIIKSYKVLYVEYDSSLDVLNKTVYWTDSYQTFTSTDIIKLYYDQDLTNYFGEYAVISYDNNPYRKKVIEWTGDRYYVNLDVSVVNEPPLIGNSTSVNVSALGVKKYSELTQNPNDVYNGKQLMTNPNKTSKTDYDYIPDTIEANQNGVYTFDVNQNWKLNNENIVRKSDYEQLNTLLKKIETCLKSRDKWFDNNQRCNLNCQVNCQNRCQVSCQACNTKQCHDQKCGTH